MIGKTLIYLVLEIRAVFLFGINLCEGFWNIVSKPSKLLLHTSVVAFILLSSFNFESYAQNKGPNCDSGERFCRGECRLARECRQGVPPPPGLSIDSKLPYLLIAGLGLGIYFLRSRKQA